MPVCESGGGYGHSGKPSGRLAEGGLEPPSQPGGETTGWRC
jgi:hypothetical protein